MAELDILARVVRLETKRVAPFPLRARIARQHLRSAHPVLTEHAGLGHIAGTTQVGNPPTPSKAKVEIRPDYPTGAWAGGIPLLAETRSKEDGSFIIRNLKAGRYRVTVSADGFFPRMFLTDVVEGE